MNTNDQIMSILKSRREALGLSLSEVARRTGIPKSTLSRYESLERQFPLSKINNIAKVLDLTSEEILGISNKVTQTAAVKKSSPAIISSPEQVIFPNFVELERIFYSGLDIKFSGYTLTEKQVRQLRGVLYAVFSEEMDLKTEKDWDIKTVKAVKQAERTQIVREPEPVYDIDDYRNVTITGIVSAGDGTWQDDNIEAEVRLPIDEIPDEGKYDSASKVVGFSMEPKIHDGDILFVNSEAQVDINGIGIFQVNGENFVKKLRHDSKNLPYLESLNPDYPDIILDEDDDIRIIGKVVGTYSK